MKITNLIESLCLMFCIWSLRLAFLAAGCWMIYNGWYGCGLTTVIVTVLIVGKYQNDDEESRPETICENCLNSCKGIGIMACEGYKPKEGVK